MTVDRIWRRMRIPFAVAGTLICVIFTPACHSGSHSADAQAGKSAAASVTADPQFIAAKALVAHCFAGTPAQQAHQVHLVFLSSTTGKHGPEVVAARATLESCLGISKADLTPFFNEAVTASRYGKVLVTHDSRVTYFETTLPRIVLKYSNAPGLGNGTASIPGTTVSPSPAATAGSLA